MDELKPKPKFPKIWTLHYRSGNIPNLTKQFIFEGTMAEAVQRARTHCEKMGYRFIYVRPFLVDLDEQENRRAQGEFLEDEVGAIR